MKRIVLHIDSLALNGFRHEDRHNIAEGLQTELGRLFSNPHTVQQLAHSGDISRLRVGNIQISQGSKPRTVGVQTARAIDKGLKK